MWNLCLCFFSAFTHTATRWPDNKRIYENRCSPQPCPPDTFSYFLFECNHEDCYDPYTDPSITPYSQRPSTSSDAED